jgi:PAS domain S-box-containing protein
MITKENTIKELYKILSADTGVDQILRRTIDLLIRAADASGGFITAVDSSGGYVNARKGFSQEAYREVSILVERGGSVGRKVIRTPGGNLLPLPFDDKAGKQGFAALEFRKGAIIPPKGDIDFLNSITGILGREISSMYSREEIGKRFEEYKRVIEKAPIGILIFDRKGKLTAINPFHTAGLSAHKGKEIIQTTNVLKDESIKHAGLLSHIKMLLRGKSFELFNHPYTTKFMKRRVFVDVRGVPYFGSDGDVEGGIVLISNVTEKANLEAELRNSRDYLENIINSLDNEVAVVDRDHNIQLVNNAFIQNYSISRDSVIGEKCYYVSHGEHKPCTHGKEKCPVEDVFRDGRSRSMVHQHLGKDNPRSMEVFYSPLRNTDGMVTNVIIVSQDITERLNLEAEREKTREELKAVFEGITDSIMVIDSDMNIVKANDGCSELFQKETKDIIRNKCHDILQGTDEACSQCPVEETFITGQPLSISDCRLEIAGEQRFADVFTYPLFDPEGDVTQVILYTRDVTDRKVLENKFRDREALLANISSDSEDAIFSLDNHDIITSWNKGAQKIFGYGEHEVVGKSIELLIRDEERRKKLQEMRSKVYGVGYVRNFEAKWMTKDEQEVDIIITRTALKSTNDEIVGSSIVIKDISRLKEMARELVHVEKLAVLGKMSATVAHEMRNPLGAITLNLDLLEEEVETSGESNDPMISELISSIRSELRRLSLLSEDYLRFTRYPKLNLSKVKFEELLANAVRSLKPRFEAQGIKLLIVPADRIGTVTMDEHQIVQAINNLLMNASEAITGPGSITVRYSMNNGFAVIQVSDTGVGIKSSDLRLIFDPFFTTKEKGTGLGLSIVKQIAELHGGKVECKSSPGEGSVFTLYFPVEVKGSEQSQ